MNQVSMLILIKVQSKQDNQVFVLYRNFIGLEKQQKT